MPMRDSSMQGSAPICIPMFPKIFLIESGPQFDTLEVIEARGFGQGNDVLCLHFEFETSSWCNTRAVTGDSKFVQ
jgi:hypothetical protein